LALSVFLSENEFSTYLFVNQTYSRRIGTPVYTKALYPGGLGKLTRRLVWVLLILIFERVLK